MPHGGGRRRDPLHQSPRRVHLRNRAVCGVANARNSDGYCCALRLAAHPDPQRTLSARFVQRVPDGICTRRASSLHRVLALFDALHNPRETPNAPGQGRSYIAATQRGAKVFPDEGTEETTRKPTTKISTQRGAQNFQSAGDPSAFFCPCGSTARGGLSSSSTHADEAQAL